MDSDFLFGQNNIEIRCCLKFTPWQIFRMDLFQFLALNVPTKLASRCDCNFKWRAARLLPAAQPSRAAPPRFARRALRRAAASRQQGLTTLGNINTKPSPRH